MYLGSLNSRMKDFYDIWRLSQQFDFQGNVLCEAVKGTFQNRNTEVIEFDDLVTDLLDNKSLDKQWVAFLRKSALTGPEEFSQMLAAIGEFLSPVFSSAKSNKVFEQQWAAPGPWCVK